MSRARSHERENRHLEVLLEQRVQGLLITPVDTANPRFEWFLERRIPVVLVDRVAGRQRLCSVAVNDRLGGQMAAAHLLDMGHRRIAFVGGPSSIQQVADRQRGATDAILEAGGQPDDLLVLETPSLRLPDGQMAGEKLATMTPDQRPTAVFCANDLLALGVLQEMTLHGLAVPGDVAIVGYDDIQYAAGAAVPLSSVRQPRVELGRTAARLLFEEIRESDGHRHRQIVFEPELIIRDSSAAPPRAVG